MITTEDTTSKTFGMRIREARLKAATFNAQFATHEGAAEALDVGDRTSIGKWERDVCTPNNHNVVKLAESYNEPDLFGLYCSSECPIGKRKAREPHLGSLERKAIKLYNAYKLFANIIGTVMTISDDGEISVDEVRPAEEIIEALNEIICSAESCKNGIRRALQKKEGGRHAKADA